MSSGFEGVLLSRPRVVGGHSPYGRLGIREDGDRAERVVPVAATWGALARAAHSASYASWPQPRTTPLVMLRLRRERRVVSFIVIGVNVCAEGVEEAQ